MTKPNPYRIDGPALISFSGGRTSGFMLHQILNAHDGALPPDAHVTFANTGKEREQTLRFVHECGTRWGVKIHWLEWIAEAPGFTEVGYNSASRAGEPFAALIQKKGYLPNAVSRFCTQELKVRAMRDFALGLGWDRWRNVIGLRYDEGARLFKAYARNDANKERFKALMPMASPSVKHTKRDVMRFWLGDNADPLVLTSPLPQGFDLGLRSYEGNCDLCFLKSRGKLEAIIREQPDAAAWWSEQEGAVTTMRATAKGARFVTEYSYADLARSVSLRPVLPGILDDDEHDVECGLLCGAEAA